MSRLVQVDLEEVRRRIAVREAALSRQRAGQMARVAAAARLPRQRVVAPQGALNSNEAAGCAKPAASTTSTRSGGLSGCKTQSA